MRAVPRTPLVVLDGERAAEVALDERLDDRQAERVARPSLKVLRQAHAVVVEIEMPVVFILLHDQADEARFAARESVLHRIEHELVEHERHRARALRRQDETWAPELRPYRELPVCHVARSQVEDVAHDLLDIDVLAALLRKVLMDNGDGEDAVDALLQRCLYLGRLGPPRLDAQQARDGLQVVLDTMVNLGNPYPWRASP